MAVEIAEAFAEGGLGRHDALLLVDPGSKLIEDRTTQSLSSIATLLRVVTGGRRFALDRKELRDDAHAFEGDAVAGAGSFHQPTSAVSPAPGALSARAFEKARDARAVALHGAREVVTEKAFDAFRVARRRIEERHPAGIGPSPYRAVADALGRTGIEHGMPVASVPSKPGARVCSSMSRATGASKSIAAATLRPSVDGATSTPARAKRVHWRSMGRCSMNLSQTASTISVSTSLPRSTICGGGDAETIVSWEAPALPPRARCVLRRCLSATRSARSGSVIDLPPRLSTSSRILDPW